MRTVWAVLAAILATLTGAAILDDLAAIPDTMPARSGNLCQQRRDPLHSAGPSPWQLDASAAAALLPIVDVTGGGIGAGADRQTCQGKNG